MTAPAIPTFTPDPALYADPSGRADRVCRFVRLMRLYEGKHAGELLKLGPFQEAIIRRIYGPCREDGGRLVRTACIWMPRGNAKTALASALALAHLAGPENEPGGQIVVAAADRSQAGIAFRNAIEFCRGDRVLSRRTQPVESQKRLKHPRSSSEMMAVSSDAATKHGLNISLFLADEIHTWKPTKARDLYGTLSDSMVKRENPLTIVISTAGAGVGTLAREMWDYSLAVARGEIEDETFAPIIFAAQPDDDWRDEAVWLKANPAMAAGFLSTRELRTKVRKAESSPVEELRFRQFHLGQWSEGTDAPWVSMTTYDTTEKGRSDAELGPLPCYLGIDLSSVSDLTAAVAVFPEKLPDDTWAYDVRAHMWLPEAKIAEKSEQDRASYQQWVRDGHMSLTPGNVVDHSVIVAWCSAFKRTHKVREVAIDRWNSTAVTVELQKRGLNVVAFGQGFASMAAPMRELERAVLTGQFRHEGHPVLRMCFANARVEIDAAENMKLTKARAAGRIDGAVAAVMAVGRALEGMNAPRPAFFSL